MATAEEFFIFECGKCGQLMEAPRKFHGKEVVCPACRKVAVAIDPDPVAAAPESTAESSKTIGKKGASSKAAPSAIPEEKESAPPAGPSSDKPKLGLKKVSETPAAVPPPPPAEEASKPRLSLKKSGDAPATPPPPPPPPPTPAPAEEADAKAQKPKLRLKSSS